MRNKWVLLCAVLLAMTSAAFAQPQELTGNDVLQNMAKAYAKLDRYVGTSAVISRVAVRGSETQILSSIYNHR
jgi:outer membrane lipoprotein-sorting protein